MVTKETVSDTLEVMLSIMCRKNGEFEIDIDAVMFLIEVFHHNARFMLTTSF